MSRNKELAKNTLIIALGKICTQFVTFFLLPVYTHFLTTEEYGTIDMVITCTNLISPVLSLQLERSVFRYLIGARKDKDLQKKIISTSFSAVIPSVLITILIFPILGLVFHIQYWYLILLIIITSIFLNISLQIPRGLGKNIHYSIGSAIAGISNALISIVSVACLHWGIKGVLLANIASHILGCVYIAISMSLISVVRLSSRSKGTLKELLKFSIPMIPSDICYWIINASDRLLIYFFIGESFNGIYAAATKFPALIVTAYNIFNMSWMETVSAHINDSDAERFISGAFNEIAKLAGSMCLVANAGIPFVFNIIIGDDFAESYKYIAILNFGAFFNIIMGALSALYFGYKKTSEIAKTNALAAVINIVINITLIRVIGIWAAVLSTVIAYMMVSSYRVINIRNTIKINPNFFNILIIVVMFGLNIWLYQINELATNIVNVVMVGLFAVLFNYGFIKSVMKKVQGKIRKV